MSCKRRHRGWVYPVREVIKTYSGDGRFSASVDYRQVTRYRAVWPGGLPCVSAWRTFDTPKGAARFLCSQLPPAGVELPIQRKASLGYRPVPPAKTWWQAFLKVVGL